MAHQELPFTWILKAVKCRECMKGTVCIIVVMLLFSAVKMSTENGLIENSSQFSFNGYTAAISSNHSSETHKDGKKKVSATTKHLSVAGMMISVSFYIIYDFSCIDIFIFLQPSDKTSSSPVS